MKEGIVQDTERTMHITANKDADGVVSENGKKKTKEERPATKVVIRRLPPSMTLETFVQQVSPLPDNDYMYFVQGDASLAPNSFSRAYINFVNQADLFIFTQKFDNYVFVDGKGQEYPAVVEFAPFQRIPKHRPGRKKDPKVGTLDSEPAYISFKEKLEQESLEGKTPGNAVKQHYFETSTASTPNKVVTTPLLEFLRTRRSERQRVREERKEERRKKENERRRVKDDQQKRAPKKADADDNVVIKVLNNQMIKDKFKEKEANRIASKKRFDEKPVKDKHQSSISDVRSKENKGRVGKSYQEERKRQAERREELRKKSLTSGVDIHLEVSAVCDSKTNTPEEKVVDSNNQYERKVSDRRKIGSDRVQRDDGDGLKKKARCGDRNGYSLRKEADQDRKKDLREGTKRSNENERYRDRNRRGSKESTIVKRERYKGVNIVDNKVQTNVSIGSGMREPEPSPDAKIVVAGDPKNILKESDWEKLGAKPKHWKEADTKLTRRNSIEIGESSGTDKENRLLGAIPKRRRNSTSQISDQVVQKDTSEVDKEKDSGSTLNETNLGKYSEIKENIIVKKIRDITLEDKERYIETGAVPKRLKDSENKNEERPDLTKTDSEERRASETGAIPKRMTEKEIKKRGKGGEVIKRRNSMEMFEEGGGEGRSRRNSLDSGERRRGTNDSLNELESKDKTNKDPRLERRIRNKDRPTMELYRPGMGRFSKQRLEKGKVLGSSTEVDSPSPSPSPTPRPKASSRTES